MSETAPTAVKSAERALRLLEILAMSGPAQFSELRRELAIPKSSLHALLGTMTAIGWVALDRKGSYVIGYRARAIGIAGMEASDVVALTDGLLEALRDELGETVHLAGLEGQDIHYLASKFSRHALNVRFDPGRRLPAYATALGKAMLAELPQDELADHLPQKLVSFTPKTVTSKAALVRELASAREAGYAEEDEQSSIGLHCFAVALDHPDLPLVAISCSVPTVRLDTGRSETIVTALLATRRDVLARLRPPARAEA